jgi:lipopolysaccharide export system permease protein
LPRSVSDLNAFFLHKLYCEPTLNTFDRYILRRFWHVFAIGFVATFGLYVVFDAFTNADEFQSASSGAAQMIGRMSLYYFFQAFPFFDLIGPILVVLSAMAVFALLQGQSEIYPVLSAGVPTWRLAVPIVIGTLTIVLGLTVNQEVAIPCIADQLHAPRGSDSSTTHVVQTARDHSRNIEITGQSLNHSERRIDNAEFLLPVPDVVLEPTTIRAERAVQYASDGTRPAGWLLTGVSQKFRDLKLTDEGRSIAYPFPTEDDLYIVSDVTIDQLYNRSTSFKYLSTVELVQRIRNPAFGIVSIRNQTLHLHERLTRPLLILFSVLIAIPMTMRRESRSLLGNMATCTAILGFLFLATQVCLHLGRLNIVDLDMAAWAPVVICGATTSWLSSSVQT